MFRWLLDLDKDIFLYLNGLHAPVWDSIMWWISGTKSWIPFYVVLLVIIIYRERPWRFIFTLLFLSVAVVLSDQISVLIKNLAERPRPTHNPEIADLVHIVNDYRGGQFGFVSSHAANVFAVAVFVANQFKSAKWSFLLLVWAFIVSYSRIYLGVHYPLDIICGGVLGALIGIQCYVFKVRTTVAVQRRIDIRQEKKEAKLKAQRLEAMQKEAEAAQKQAEIDQKNMGESQSDAEPGNAENRPE